MDLLHKSPGKEVLLEVEKEKKSEHRAPSQQVYKWILYFNHKISVYAIALIGMAGQCYQWHLDQTSGCFWACNQVSGTAIQKPYAAAAAADEVFSLESLMYSVQLTPTLEVARTVQLLRLSSTLLMLHYTSFLNKNY